MKRKKQKIMVGIIIFLSLIILFLLTKQDKKSITPVNPSLKNQQFSIPVRCNCPQNHNLNKQVTIPVSCNHK